MKRFLFAAGVTLLFALTGADARAQTGTARGKVLDDKGQPIADAKVDVAFLGGVTRKFSIQTNKRGEYTQVGLPTGVYRFTATKEGYQSGFVELKVGIGDATVIPEMKLRSIEAVKQEAAASGQASLATPFKAALDLMNAGKLSEAEAAFKDLMAKHPSVPQIPVNLGQIYSRRNENEAAEAAYQQAIKLDDTYSDAYVALSNLYLNTKRSDQAVELSKKAAADHPEDARLQLQLGFVCFNTGRSDEAVVPLQKALELDASEAADANYYLGTIAVGQNKVADAVAYLEKYMASNPPAGQNRQSAEGLLGYLKPKK